MVSKKATLMAVVAMACALGSAAMAQGPAYKAPRGPDKVHPDLNGVWQVLNSANYNIEPHLSSAAMAMRPGPVVPVPAKEVVALGAVGAIPPGPGVVVGGTIPYKPEALAKRDENRAQWLSRDPEIKCYLPGVPRAMRASRSSVRMSDGGTSPANRVAVRLLVLKKFSWRRR